MNPGMRRATDLPKADAVVSRERSLSRTRLGAPPFLTKLFLDAALSHDRHAATKRQSLSGHERGYGDHMHKPRDQYVGRIKGV